MLHRNTKTLAMSTLDNHKIVKNSLYLYLRKIITVIIGLYSSRLLLKELGLDNFGLYGLIGSVILMFASLKVVFTDSIQRFLNIEKGKNNIQRLRLVFTYGVSLNCCISIIFIIVSEICGYIIIPKLNIAPYNINPAFWILHFSILSAVVAIMTTPYDAVLIANEKFNAYALFAILDAVLRFCSVLLLCLLEDNRVIAYSIFLFIAGVIVRICSAIYCHKHYRVETKYFWKIDSSLLKDMTKFSSWNFLGKVGYTVYESLLNIILNLFGGVIVNAARAIAINVRQLVLQFTNDTLAGFRPQTIRAYGATDNLNYHRLIFNAIKFSFIVSAILAFLCSVFCSYLVKIWLDTTPPYSIEFIKCIMLYLLVVGIHCGVEMIFITTAKIKQYQIYSLVTYICSLCCAWLALKNNLPYYSVFLIAAIFEFIRTIIDIYLAYRICSFPIKELYTQVISKCIYVSIILIVSYIFFSHLFLKNQTWYTFLIEGIIALAYCMIVCYLIVLSKTQKRYIYNILISKVR